MKRKTNLNGASGNERLSKTKEKNLWIIKDLYNCVIANSVTLSHVKHFISTSKPIQHPVTGIRFEIGIGMVENQNGTQFMWMQNLEWNEAQYE